MSLHASVAVVVCKSSESLYFSLQLAAEYVFEWVVPYEKGRDISLECLGN